MITSKTISGPDEQILQQCLKAIETKVDWGQAANWTTGDFERLSDAIARQTGISLSVTTLKRVWGRVKYESAPTETTLNALAVFAGYENWRDFRCATRDRAEVSAETSSPVLSVGESIMEAPTRQGQTRSRSRLWAGTAIGAALAGVLIFFQNHSAPPPPNPADYSFSSRPVTRGIPNSVVFSYDASASPTDSVFIQQSWDARRRQPVSKAGRNHTSIYYYPGFFKAKLVIGSRVVREHDLYIPSEDWVVAVKHEPVPVYFERKETVRNGLLNLPVAAIERQNIPMQPKSPGVRYRHVPDLKGLRNDNFIFETRLKNDYSSGSAACQLMDIVILCEDDIFSIPLGAKGCIANLNLYLAGLRVPGNETDLSAFGFGKDQWVTVRCEVRDRQVQLFVDGQTAYEATLPNKPAKLVGISYEFEGTGSVDYTRFSRLNGEVVYEEDFGGSETLSNHSTDRQ